MMHAVDLIAQLILVTELLVGLIEILTRWAK